VLTDGGPDGLKVIDRARTLAETLGARVQVVLTRQGETSDLIAVGADRVYVPAEALGGDAESVAGILAPFLEEARPEFILCADGWLGREVAPRLAQRLDAGLATRCLQVSINESDRTLVAVRPMYEGEYYQEVHFAAHWPQMATLITASLSLPYLDSSRSGEVETYSPAPIDSRIRQVEEVSPPNGPVPLETASIVISGGAGLGQDNFEKLQDLAEKLRGSVAGAREAFELGWIEKGGLVDIAGHKLSPRLYMAFGIAGDVMHSAGIKGAGYVVAVHSDPDAPIFAQADLGIVAHPAQVIDRLLAAL
jgi:electron transfer flavoprotein alpha subunit